MADVSSCFLSEPVDVSKYAIIYGGVQKNIGPAGMVIAIVRDDLITDDVLPGTPTMMKYKTHADANSLYNTPNCYCIYICGKVFKWLKKQGGLEAMKERNEKKAKILYDYLDESKPVSYTHLSSGDYRFKRNRHTGRTVQYLPSPCASG